MWPYGPLEVQDHEIFTNNLGPILHHRAREPKETSLISVGKELLTHACSVNSASHLRASIFD